MPAGPNETSTLRATSAPGQAIPTTPLRSRTGVLPRVPVSASPAVPADTRVPRPSLRTIAPSEPGHRVSVCPASVRLEMRKLSNRTGVQRRSAARPRAADQLPSIGSTRLSTRPPGKAPLSSARPAKPIAPPGSCTSLSSGKATMASPARYGASTSEARAPPPEPLAPRRSNRPSICGKPGPSLSRLPASIVPPLPPNVTVTFDSAASRAPLPPRHSAPGSVRLVNWPFWRTWYVAAKLLPLASRANALRSCAASGATRVPAPDFSSPAKVTSSPRPGDNPVAPSAPSLLKLAIRSWLRD